MKLKKYIKENGLTVKEMALKLGVSRQAVHGWLNGNSVPGAANLYKITMITGGAVALSDFVDFD